MDASVVEKSTNHQGRIGEVPYKLCKMESFWIVGINSDLVMNKLIPTIIRGATAGDMDE